MIIKRTMKIEMPKLKRCKVEENESEEYGYEAVPKKRRVIGFYSLAMPAGEDEDFSSGSGSLCSEGSCWASEVLSNSNSKQLNCRTGIRQGAETLRPPLLRSSRGRSQMLPSRFSDSVLDAWKNGGIKAEDTDSSFEDDNILVEDRVGDSRLGYVKQEKVNNYYRSKKSEYYSYPDLLEESGFDGTGLNNFDYRKHGTSFSTTRKVKTESYTSELSFEGVDQKLNPNAEKAKDFYKPEDFALGDIVWAKCGKRYPAWPAVVIDPMLQAPKSVLSCCVPGAICVMFFGYSKNGKQRVNFLPLYFGHKIELLLYFFLIYRQC